VSPHKAAPRSSVRAVLWAAQDGACWLCDAPMRRWSDKAAARRADPLHATIDHVLPRAMFGRIGDLGVTLLAHRGCNTDRGCRPPSEADLRRLVAVWRRVDRAWLAAQLAGLEGELRQLDAKRARVALLREIGGA
jgi:hypothetical protein